MKHTLLVTLLTVTSFSAIHTMDQDPESRSLIQNRDTSREPRWKTIARVAVIGSLVTTGLVGSSGALISSIHDDSSKIGLPYNQTLPANYGNCTYSYGDPCRREIDENSVDITNEGTCCWGAMNFQECEEWCKKSGKKSECVILENCEAEKVYDRSFGWSLASLLGQTGALIAAAFSLNR